MSPSMPVSSAMEVTRRLPSDRRCNCTIMRTAAAIWPRIEGMVIGRPAMPISCSRREIASRGLLAWMDGHRTFMAGIHRLKHVEGLFAATLAEDDTFGTHAQ